MTHEASPTYVDNPDASGLVAGKPALREYIPTRRDVVGDGQTSIQSPLRRCKRLRANQGLRIRLPRCPSSNLKDYQGAVDDFTQALSYDSRDQRVFIHRAQARAELGDYDKELQDVDTALKLDPEHHNVIRLRRKLRDEGAY